MSTKSENNKNLFHTYTNLPLSILSCILYYELQYLKKTPTKSKFISCWNFTQASKGDPNMILVSSLALKVD